MYVKKVMEMRNEPPKKGEAGHDHHAFVSAQISEIICH